MLALCACGGASEQDRPTQTNNEGSGASAGTSATPPEPVPLSEWPWFVDGPGATNGMLNAENGVLTLSFPAGAQRMAIQTHHHFDMLATHHTVAFDAVANRPVTLLVAFTGLLDTDYWSDLAAGSPWMAAPADVGTTNQSYVMPLESFAPQGPGTPRPMFEMGTMIWFVIEDASGLELDLANIRLE